MWCDNIGGISCSKEGKKRVPSALKHAKILRFLIDVKKNFPGRLSYYHIKSHQDDLMEWNQLLLEAKLNCICDILAKSDVARGLIAPHRRQYSLPFEAERVFLQGSCAATDIGPKLHFHVGRVEAQKYYHNFHNFLGPVFDLVAEV